MKIFVDANILIDIMLEREPFYNTAATFMTYCAEHDYKMVTNSLCISNAYYLSQQLIRNTKITAKKIAALNTICPVIQMNQSQLDLAIQSSFNDFEDALHDASAIENNCTHIITRDRKGFKKSQLIILTPALFLKQHEA